MDIRVRNRHTVFFLPKYILHDVIWVYIVYDANMEERQIIAQYYFVNILTSRDNNIDFATINGI